MHTKFWPFYIVMVCGSLSSNSWAVAAISEAHNTISVQQLIGQLGNEQYVLRQSAETQLLERGVEAFAQLQVAEKHTDLEIAKRAKYILNQISIDWVRPTDLPLVQAIMARYGELSPTSRLSKVAQLAKLENAQGFGALARIARFESSGRVARFAALAIVEKGFLPTARTESAVAMLKAELEESSEAPQSWVGVYLDQLQSPQQIDSRWLTLIDAEIELLAEETGETNKPFVLTLLNSHLELSAQISDAESIVAGLQRQIELGPSSDQTVAARLIQAITWLTEREQWDALELLEERYANAIQSQRLLLYLVADARDKQGRSEDAEEIAKRALQQVETDDPFADTDAQSRNRCASVIADLGHHDWAEREWKSVIYTVDATDVESLKARQSLGLFCFHDRLDHQGAADLLSEAIDGVEADPAIKEHYQANPNLWYRLTILKSNREYFLAFHSQAQEDTDQQRRHLEQAYKLDPSNADVLIAMYQLKDSTPAHRNKTRERIAKSLKSVEAEIKKAKNEPHWYNHWAWLVSNTEGDFDRAVQYSQRSLELEPGSPSYLDTLGRCYFAAGDVESAVEVQREAVSKHPHLMVMQRQLQQFEDELQKNADSD